MTQQTREGGRVVWSTRTAANLRDVVGPRTLAIVDARRTGKSRRTRGWLVRRALVGADLIGLSFAFVVAELLYPPTGHGDPFHPWFELLAFALTLPAWVITARLYGLYTSDEERNDHATVDDLVGIFHLVTIGAWIF